MTRHEISCVTKVDRDSPWECITHVGGPPRWKLPQERVIRSIESGNRAFFVRVGGREVDVVVAVSRYGNKYIRSVSDGEQPNNLLSLPECPR